MEKNSGCVAGVAERKKSCSCLLFFDPGDGVRLLMFRVVLTKKLQKTYKSLKTLADYVKKLTIN